MSSAPAKWGIGRWGISSWGVVAHGQLVKRILKPRPPVPTDILRLFRDYLELKVK